MELTRRSLLVYGLLVAVWALVLGWQVEEHKRVKEAAKTDLRSRSKDIANTLSAIIRGLRFRGGAIPAERLEPVLNELVHGRTNELVKSSEILYIALLNAANERVAWAGQPIDPHREDLFQEGEHWGRRSVTLVNPVVLGASLSSEGVTNAFITPPLSEITNRMGEAAREFPRRGPPPPEHVPPDFPGSHLSNAPPPPPDGPDGRPREGRGRFRRPYWMLGLDDEELRSLIEKRSLHGLVLTVSTEGLNAAADHDLWLRTIITLLATVSVLGSGLAWRNLAKSSDLQIRLVRASEMNTHLKEMNLAAAGLAHETRNPLNIIRGLAQMISKQPGTPAEIQKKSREIIDEADKVAAQLNEFINYSRPREVRRSKLALGSVVNEVVRALNYDLEEKKISLQIKGEQLSIEADEQLLRQALFNLLLNAIQAVNGNGEIELSPRSAMPPKPRSRYATTARAFPPTAAPRSSSPTSPPRRWAPAWAWQSSSRSFLPTAGKSSASANEPQGAVFRITHLKLAI